jgi:hypothetical protein
MSHQQNKADDIIRFLKFHNLSPQEMNDVIQLAKAKVEFLKAQKKNEDH